MPGLDREAHVIDIGGQRLLMRPKIVSEKRHIELAAMDVRAGQQFFQACLQARSEP